MGQIVFQATLGGQTALVGQNTASSYSLTLPLATDTLVGKATTDTLTNKTLTSPTINGGTSTATQNLANVTGTLAVGNGGTGLTSLTSGYIPYGNGTSAFSSSSNLYFSGSNLGIGTSSPSSLLSLSGSNASPIGLSITNSNSGTVTNLSSMGATGSGVTNWANSTVLESIPTSTGGLVLSSYTGFMYFQTNGRQTFMTLNSAGYLGIGTTTPAQQLSVMNHASVTGGHSNTLTSGAYFYLRGDSGSGAGQGSFFQINANYGLDTWLYNTNTSTFNLATTLSSTGQLGIGTSSPSYTLDVNSSNVSSLRITGAGTSPPSLYSYSDSGGVGWMNASLYSNGALYYQTGKNHYWFVGSSQAMTLNNSGNLGIGTSSPSQVLSLQTSSAPGISISDGTNTSFVAQITSNGNFGNGSLAGQLYLRGAVGIGFSSTNGSTTNMQLDSSGNLGLGVTPFSGWAGGSGANSVKAIQLSLYGTFDYDGGGYTNLGSNYYNASGTYKYGASDYASRYSQGGGKHAWYTAPSGTAGNTITFTQAMTLDNSGNLLLGTTSSYGGARTNIAVIPGTNVGTTYQPTSNSTYNSITFNNSSGTQVGYIQSTSSATVYSVTSDQRLKQNIVDAPAGNINQIKVRSFDWITDGSHQQYGMVAQELVEVAPYAVSLPTNSNEMMGIDYSKLVPMMIKEIQDLKAEVNQLKQKLGV